MTTPLHGLTFGPDELTARYLTGSDGHPDGMMGEFQRIIHVRVP
ncbi:MAG: hypothetical protein ACREF4_11785 [Gammaproteobacteria bacterium]